MNNDMRITRRGALKVGATFAAGAAAVGGLSDASGAENLRRFERRRAVDSKHRILLKGGTIISMDPKVGDVVQGDMLIEGKKIAAIAPEINAAGAQMIDAHDTNVCPRSDAQYALGEGICALQRAWDHGIKPGLSVDNETSYSADMFMEMRMALYLQRALAQNRRFSGDQNPPKPLMVRDVLYCATMGGAHCAGLDDKIGSLTPGKEADLIMIRADDINLYPSNNAIGTVVQAAERSNVDTVIVGGRVRKYRGKVVGLDMKRLKTMVEESRSHLFAAAGYRPDVFAELLPKLS